MSTGKSDISKFRYPHRGTSLKSAIQKRLLIRLLVAGILVSIVLAAIVFFLEFHRLGRSVNQRAGQISARFNDEIRDLLDDRSMPEKPALRNKLRMLSVIGRLNMGIGKVIYAGIYDLNGEAVVIEKDADCPYIDKVDPVMTSWQQDLPTAIKTVYEFNYINGTPHIQLTFPLTNNNDQQAAVLSGVFAVSSSTMEGVVDRIVRTALQTIGIVFITTLILYPTILTLINRLSALADNLLEANIETLQVLGSAIAKRDSETDIHNYRVTIYSVTLAEAVGLRQKQIRGLIKGAFLHDIGKIGISDKILLKPGKLTKRERGIMRGHVRHGIDIVERSDWLKDAIDVVGYHHEQFAGGGYPYGLEGDAIPITARIFAIADIFDALTSKRPYKEPISFDDTMTILAEDRDAHFDPSLLDTFNTIAKSLYQKVANASDAALREKLESITRQYFSKKM